MADPPPIDPYARCEGSCTHDLARGVLVDELNEKDGPYVETVPLDLAGAFVRAALRVRSASELIGLQR